jgi:UDPglucose--hexose-1-phosphate uridylyltransferase
MPDALDSGSECPFCPGNERYTPKPTQEIRDREGKWLARAFHDRAPLLRIEGDLDRRGEGIFDRMNTVGAHEVVVDTPYHGTRFSQHSAEHIGRIIELCRDRILDLKQDARFRYISLFKDQRPPSPSFHGHSHAQILATPVMPQLLEIELRWCLAHFKKKERCLFCDIVKQELQEDRRVVDRSPDYVAICPFSSRTPYEVWILPVNHSSTFEKDMVRPGHALALARFLKTSLQRLENLSPEYDLVVHTEPNLQARKPSREWWKTIPEDFHWHIEIRPQVEGFRRHLGTAGFYFNPIPAEEATVVLRALEPESAIFPESKG